MNSEQKVLIDGQEFEVKSPNSNDDVIEGVCDDVIDTMKDIGMDDEELQAAAQLKEQIKKGRVVIGKAAKGGDKIMDRVAGFFEGKRGITKRYPNGT